ncbi:3-hydroxyisobutyrate dehydrogenase-like, mitochondrial [Acrasis kona]|uniref:3-hydroxyisobutyrate dehydrogenase-like, mitochondrial n=1 Tax=Acrasis kona TaxID=1008807 RepID=A0AAW2Z0U4_9EUKA
MAGGEEEVFNAVQTFLASMGEALNYWKRSTHQDEQSNFNRDLHDWCCRGFIIGTKSGVDVEKVLAAVSAGAANSFSLQSYATRILKRDFNPGFYAGHFVKDIEEMGLNLPGLKLAKQLYDQLTEQGGTKYGTQALILALEKLNNIQ